MPLDRSFIRVKAMLLAPDTDGTAHAVSLNPPTTENPLGYHRLVGGSVELGETHRHAIRREVREELEADVHDLELFEIVEPLPLYPGVAGGWGARLRRRLR
ncbi:hypothetical protein NOK12_26440 [Nocardioides sp. OK12]|uniref:NUDIX domain-containing protein n=1 Tax=Nocardioides sp. OK12 TaxID=2758661 RepID=UPI0021C4787C|nr:NUDIX domain-containing protein [Nocardioides sp. OK12]GHJ60126.1 hypothetical protein NOK12_26440 [Nocardioides sp. OK12]